MKENWKLWYFEEKPTVYEVSNLGKIRNVVDGHELHTVINASGYELVHVSPSRRFDKMIPVHRLVAQCFCKNPNNYTEIDHRNNNPRDNRAINLRWCSREQNLSHRRGWKKRAVICYTLENEYVNEFDCCATAGRAIGLTNGHGIKACCEGWQQTAGGYRWSWACSEDGQMYLF